MPLRNESGRVCDPFMRDIVLPNNPDVFIATDSNDFFFDGKQYYDKSEVTNGNSYRYLDDCEVLSHEDAKQILEREMFGLFGDMLKGIKIDPTPEDISDDPKYNAIKHITDAGCTPSMLVKQYRKIRNAYEMMHEYEQTHGQYDVVMKTRFDNRFIDASLCFERYDLKPNEIYGPGFGGPCVYDWYAFGYRDSMEYMNLYDKLGFTLTGHREYFMDCERDGGMIDRPVREDEIHQLTCPRCGSDNLRKTDISIGSEYHIYKTCAENNITVKHSGFGSYVYQYRDPDIYH
jgi:hypothetical protein